MCYMPEPVAFCAALITHSNAQQALWKAGEPQSTNSQGKSTFESYIMGTVSAACSNVVEANHG